MKNPVRLVNRVNFEKELQEKKLECEDMIRKYLPKEEGFAAQLAEAMNYSMEAGGKRLRPILMTSFAFVLGVMPLLFATGAGAQSRIALGAAVVFGMALNTLLATIYIPNFYELMQKFQENILDRKKKK